MNLSLKGLFAGYKERIIIEDISLDVSGPMFLGIIGPNGAGKSTLFKSASGVLKPYRGKVLLNGRDIYSISRIEAARQLAAVPQVQWVHFPYKVKEFIYMGRYPHRGRFGLADKEDARIVGEVVESMEIKGLEAKRIDELSGGEFQSVCIAQALVQQPQIIMLDEPTAHLDVGHQVRLLNLLKKWCMLRGISVIAVLHDLNLASAYCDQIVLLDRGRIFSKGSPAEVLTEKSINHIYKTKVVVLLREGIPTPYILLNPKGISH